MVEIMVVVSIIGILSAIGIGSYASALSKTKSLKKKADIDTLASAYELKYNARDHLYQPLSEEDFSDHTIPNNPSYSGIFTDPVPAFLLCANLESNNSSCSSPSATCYCKNSSHVAQLAVRGGGGAGPTPTPTPTSSPKQIFVTKHAVNGTINGFLGLTGANAWCQSEADQSNLTRNKTWKAWLSDANTSAGSNIATHNNTLYQLVDNNTTVANSWSDLTSGALVHQINKDQFGDVKADAIVWTNTNSNSSTNSTRSNCNNWTSIEGISYTGKTAYPNGRSADNAKWTEFDSDNCSGYNFLYCFEQ